MRSLAFVLNASFIDLIFLKHIGKVTCCQMKGQLLENRNYMAVAIAIISSHVLLVYVNQRQRNLNEFE